MIVSVPLVNLWCDPRIETSVKPSLSSRFMIFLELVSTILITPAVHTYIHIIRQRQILHGPALR